MAGIVQILWLPLICVVLAEGHLDTNKPYFGIPQLQHLAQSEPDSDPNNQPLNKNADSSDPNFWLHHIMRPTIRPNLSDKNIYVYNRHHRHDKYRSYNPFVNGRFDPYFGEGPHGMANFDSMPMPYPMLGIHNRFNDHKYDFDSYNHQSHEEGNVSLEKPVKDSKIIGNVNDSNEKPIEKLTVDNQPIPNEDLKSKDAANPEKNKSLEKLPPKTNKTSKDKLASDEIEDDKTVHLNEKKDYLLVDSAHSGNNAYLLHENHNVGVLPNSNKPGKIIIFVPYNPSNNQLVNGPINSLSTNPQTTSDKLNANGNNNVGSNIGQPTMNLNSANQNSGYVLVYSNGQIIQIPGVVVNPVQSNVPLQNVNPVQGTNYVVANIVPNNIQNVPVQNPTTHVIYTTLPNQGTSGQIVDQMPNCNHVCSTGTMVPNPMQSGATIISNNDLANLPNNQNPNVVSQPVVVPPNMVLNGYQPNNQNMALQPAVGLPVNSVSNEYTQPSTLPNQGQNTNIGVNNPSQNVVTDNENVPLQPAITLPISSVSNGYNQPSVSTQANPGTNGVVNMPNHDTAVKQPDNQQPVALPATFVTDNHAIVLDNNNLSSLGAQPAIMVSGFKESADKTKDNNKSKDEKNKKDKEKENKNEEEKKRRIQKKIKVSN